MGEAGQNIYMETLLLVSPWGDLPDLTAKPKYALSTPASCTVNSELWVTIDFLFDNKSRGWRHVLLSKISVWQSTSFPQEVGVINESNKLGSRHNLEEDGCPSIHKCCKAILFFGWSRLVCIRLAIYKATERYWLICMETMQHLEVKSRLPSMLFGRFLFKKMNDINSTPTTIKSKKEITSNLVIITKSIQYLLLLSIWTRKCQMS